MASVAVYIPFGPGSTESARVIDLLRSIVFFEPAVCAIILVEDGTHNISFDSVPIPKGCSLVVLPHPRPYHKRNLYGGLCTADLLALDYVDRHVEADFILKLDTDSLIVSRFSDKVMAVIDGQPEAGTIGVLGDSCHLGRRSFRMDEVVVQAVDGMLALGHALRTGNSSQASCPIVQLNTATDCVRFRELCLLLAPLVKMNFRGAHCQGGAYVVSREMVRRLSEAQILRKADLWLNLLLGEDQMMGILTTLVGLKTIDSCLEGQMFGVQACGLPYSPNELLSRGFGVIHSVKGDPDHREDEIRAFFRSLRE